MTDMYTTNYPINLFLYTPEIYRRLMCIEFAQICVMLFKDI
jgi:hypothetical protein